MYDWDRPGKLADWHAWLLIHTQAQFEPPVHLGWYSWPPGPTRRVICWMMTGIVHVSLTFCLLQYRMDRSMENTSASRPSM
jgi:hypothetical protein